MFTQLIKNNFKNITQAKKKKHTGKWALFSLGAENLLPLIMNLK